MRTITKKLVLEIKENVECPELGFTHYGKWGGSSREQRLTTNALCDDWLWRYELLDDLVMRIEKAKKHTMTLREKYFKECVAGSSYELGELISILEGGSNE